MIYKHISVAALTPAIGADINGVDIAQALSAEVVVEIRAAFLEHLVVFFHDQALSPAQLVAFSKRFGEIGYYPFVAGMPEHPEVVAVVKKADEKINFGGLWHTDTSYLERPPMGSVLYAVEVPKIGGDTLWNNMYMAYDALSPTLQTVLHGLRGVNSAEKPDAAVTRTHRMAEAPKDAREIVTSASHPLVRTHPETGRRALYCAAAHTMSIDGMSVDESRALLQYLYSVQQREEFGCRVHWKAGMVAFWDNRCAQHNALNDYHGSRREMHRVTLEGEVPV